MTPIDESFAAFMAATLPNIPRNGLEWYSAKLAFIGGHVMTLGVPDDKANCRLAELALEECRLLLLFANFKQEAIDALPPDQVMDNDKGERWITPAGATTLFTQMEQAEPQRAQEYRTMRYQVLASMQRLATL